MMISAELSFYPLQDDFKPPVKQVIAKLNSFSDVEVLRTSMSTLVFGEFDQVTRAINETMAWAFENFGASVFVAKYIADDRRPKTA